MKLGQRPLGPAALGLGLGVLYLATLSRWFNFDGVCFAQHLESGQARLLFHPNHLLYSATGWLYWQAESLLLAGRSLWALQRLNALAGAAGAGALAWLLSRRFPAGASLLATAGFALTYGWWINATDAQAYLPATAVGLLALKELLAPDERPRRAWKAGLAVAAFTLYHQLGALAAIPVGLHFLRRGGRRSAALAVGAAAGLSLAAYAAVYAAGRPEGSALRWFLGNAASLSPLDALLSASPGSGTSWLGNLAHLARQGGVWFIGDPHPGAWGKLGTAAVWGLLGWLAWRSRRLEGKDRALAQELWLWVGTYLFFLTFTHDRNIGYLLFAFLPLPAIVLLVLPGLQPPFRKALAALLPCLFLANGSAAMNWRRLDKNPDWPALETLARTVLPTDYLLFGGQNDYWMGRAYLPYFTAIPGTSLMGLLWRTEGRGLPGLGETLERVQSTGGSVYVLSGALDPAEWERLERQFHLEPGRLRRALGGLKLDEAARVPPGLTLYRLRPGFTAAGAF